ncbi:hypothetical protein [Paenibacillus sp. 481]|nr:hypothetical protein [Paenibacillus sp. 481]
MYAGFWQRFLAHTIDCVSNGYITGYWNRPDGKRRLGKGRLIS